MPTNGEEIISWLEAFERSCSLHQIPQQDLTKTLTQYLRGSALITFSKFTLQQSRSYQIVRDEILKTYRLNPHKYWLRFKSLHRQGIESYTQFSERLRAAYGHYLTSKEIDSLDALIENNIYLQMCEALPPEVRHFVDERSAETVNDVAKYADLSFELRNKLYDDSRRFGNRPKFGNRDTNWGSQTTRPTGHQITASYGQPFRATRPTQGAGGPQFRGSFNAQRGKNRPAAMRNMAFQGPPNCGYPGNRPYQASFVKAGDGLNDKMETCEAEEFAYVTKGNSSFVIPCYINGKSCQAVRDTGASVCVVSSEPVSPHQYTGRQIVIKSVFGE